MAFVPERLRDVARELQAGETVDPVSVRMLLAFFGNDRRGRGVVATIRAALDDVGLVTRPDFDSVWIDDRVQFHLATEGDPTAEGAPVPEVQPAPEPQAPFIGGAVPDPTHKVGKLEAANRGVVSVGPDDTVARAVTLMMANGYSQLPVMTSERDVKGMITWESIARKVVLAGGCDHVRDCMEGHHEIAAEASLFAAIPEIVQSQYVLVRAKDRKITGIVSAADLSVQFRQLAEPFLLLGEIEHQIRRLIENRFTQTELAEAKDPGDPERTVTTVADLSLGECIRLLENGERWQKLGLKIDRVEFVKGAHCIRAIRNTVMHFDPDPMNPDDLQTLRRFAGFVSELAALIIALAAVATA
jgi:CBS domain-containing protein